MQSHPIALPPKDKLEIIQLVDCFHPWRSLDEKRECRRCGAIFTGAEIEVDSGVLGLGLLRLHCPTEGCCSVPIEWMMLPEDTAAPQPTAPMTSLQSDREPAPVYHARPNRGGRHGWLFGFLRVPRLV